MQMFSFQYPSIEKGFITHQIKLPKPPDTFWCCQTANAFPSINV